MTLAGKMIMDHSTAILRNGSISVKSGFTLCNNSTLKIDGVNATLRLFNDGLKICNNSALIVESGALLDLSDSIVIPNGATLEQILKFIRSGGTEGGEVLAARSPNVFIDATSRLEIRSGASILGVGAIDGLVVNNGGKISYRAGKQSGLFIDTLRQNQNASIQTGVSLDPTSQLPIPSTALLLRNATLDGSINFYIDAALDAGLRNATDFVSVVMLGKLQPGTGGLLLLNVTESAINMVPTLNVLLSNGQPLNGKDQCAYSIEKRSSALYLVFDVNRPCVSAGAPGSPSAKAVEAETAALNLAAVIVPVVLIVAIGAVILAFVLVPSLRHRVFRVEAAKREIQKRQRDASVPAS